MKKPKIQRWWPGIFEGKTAEQVTAEIGTAASNPDWHLKSTPRSMRGVDLKTARLRLDGKLCEPLNGRTG